MYYLDRAEWHEPNRTSYELGQICQHIFRIGAMLSSGKSKIPELEKFLLKFKGRDGGDDGLPPVNIHDFKGGGGRRGINIGDPLDEHWKSVDMEAKKAWMSALGAFGPDIEMEYKNGHQRT